MGHTINPIVWRIKEVLHWNINFFVRYNYNYLTLKLSNFLIVLISYLKFLRKLFLGRYCLNFDFLRLCVSGNRFIIIIFLKFSIKKPKKKKKMFLTRYKHIFLRIYFVKMPKIFKKIFRYKTKLSFPFFEYIYIKKIPIDYRYFHKRIIKKSLKKKTKKQLDLIKLKKEKLLKKIKKKKIIKKILKFNKIKKIKLLNKKFKILKFNKIKKTPKLWDNEDSLLKYYSPPLVSFGKKNKSRVILFLLNRLHKKVKKKNKKEKVIRLQFILVRKMYSFFILIPLFSFLKRLVLTKFLQLEGNQKFFKQIQVNFYFYKKYFLPASFYTNFLVRRLQNTRVRVRRMLFNLASYLSKRIKRKKIRGYKFSITGRLSKKDRVTFIWENKAVNPNTQKFILMDYNEKTFFTRYSLGIVKFWIYF